MLALLIPGVSMGGGGTASAPVFSGVIPNISETQNTGTHSSALGAYFSGATGYSIAPAVETGWTFDTVTGELVIDTDAVGVFGPFVVTATNVVGTADSNAFSVAVVAAVTTDQPSGGWEFVYTYEVHLKRRRDEERKRQELEEATERIESAVDREIAQFMRAQEAIDAKRADLERLKTLAQQDANLEAARRYSEQVAKALELAIERGTLQALADFDKAMKQARDEDEQQFLLMAVDLLLH